MGKKSQGTDIDNVDFTSDEFASFETQEIDETNNTDIVDLMEMDTNTQIVIQGVKNPVRALCVLLSQCPDKEYDNGQAGECEFSFDNVIEWAYRCELDFSDKDIKAEINRLVRKGDLFRTKKNHFKACELWQLSTKTMLDKIKKEIANRPISR